MKRPRCPCKACSGPGKDWRPRRVLYLLERDQIETLEDEGEVLIQCETVRAMFAETARALAKAKESQ